MLLQLLVDLPNEAAIRKIQRKYGYDSAEDFKAQLAQCMTMPEWRKALAVLLSQVSDQSIFELAFDPEKRLTELEDYYRLFPWSKCGVPVMDMIWDAVRAATSLAIPRLLPTATLTLCTSLTNRLYTTPNDQVQSAKRTVGQVLDRELCVRLRDTPIKIFGSAHASVVGVYKRARDLHEQIKGTVFDDLICSYPAPKADSRFNRGPRNLPDDTTVNTAGLFAFGPYHSLWGAWNSYAVGCYATLGNMFHGAFDEKTQMILDDMTVLLRSGFAYVALSRAVFVCRFPKHVSLDHMNRLHNTNGPALIFPDGYKIYALHGVHSPPGYVEEAESVTGRDIELERNIELRRVLIDRFGVERYLRETGAAVVDRSERGTLYRKQQAGDESMMIVQVRNSTPEPDGSYKDYFLRVPPTMQTAQEAIAWTFGLKPDDYDPLVET